MANLLLRGRTLSFRRWPDSADDGAAYRFEEDGGVLVRTARSSRSALMPMLRGRPAPMRRRSITGRI